MFNEKAITRHDVGIALTATLLTQVFFILDR